MQVVQERLLRGANLYSRHPCLVATIALDDAVVPLADAARAVGRYLSSPLPLSAGADAGWLVAQAALQLQRSCGHALDVVHSEALAPGSAQRRIVIQYALEHVAQRALATALEMVGAAMRGDDYDPAPALAALHVLSLGLALPPRIGELVAVSYTHLTLPTKA